MTDMDTGYKNISNTDQLPDISVLALVVVIYS